LKVSSIKHRRGAAEKLEKKKSKKANADEVVKQNMD
jgi:hypothetical protein